MTTPASSTDKLRRLEVFRAVLPYFGKILPSAFFQKTQQTIPSVERLHPLIEGIYKPVWSVYPLCIASMLKSQYCDQVAYNSDRTWWINYSPKEGGLDLAVNAGLLRCLHDREPVLVIRQISTKLDKAGAQHRLLGLGCVEQFDIKTDLFRIRGMDWAEISASLGMGLSDELVETALRLESLEEWQPFVAEERAVYRVNRQKRDDAFSGIVLTNYEFACAVTGQRFNSAKLVEAEGAHIISKEKKGTDDPRNGIALSKSVHWAFDRGLFTISDQYEVLINPKARSANIARFPLFELDRAKISLPADRYYWPHLDALAWHKKEVFDRFSL